MSDWTPSEEDLKLWGISLEQWRKGQIASPPTLGDRVQELEEQVSRPDEGQAQTATPRRGRR